MVATSLPFWMQQSSRVMSPFPDFPVLRAPLPTMDESRSSSPDAQAIDPTCRLRLTSEFCDAKTISSHERAWTALAARALEPNVFLEPGFALPALRHFPPAQWPGFLLVWGADQAGTRSLVGLCALRPTTAIVGPKVTTAWIHDLATTGAPMLDRDRAGEALDVMLDALARRSPDWSGLLLQGVAQEGALMALLADPRRQTIDLERRERVVLRRPPPAAVATARHASARRAKDMRRQARRLQEQGAWTHTSARTPDEVRSATERFLDLEARGWKGGRGTALLNHPGLAAFTRAMTRRLARVGLCHIDTLSVGGQPAAMGVMLRSGDRAFFWKTAYDERFSRYSPGKQLADRMGKAQLADPGLALTDSCAVPGHPMIGHVWGDRMAVVDLLVAGPAVEPSALARAARLHRLGRRCRSLAKSLRDALRRA